MKPKHIIIVVVLLALVILKTIVFEGGFKSSNPPIYKKILSDVQQDAEEVAKP